MDPSMLAVVCIYLAFGLLEFFGSSLLHKPGQTRDDGIVEIISFTTLSVVTQPAIIYFVNLGLATTAPQWKDALTSIPVWAALGLFLVFDDMTQYAPPYALRVMTVILGTVASLTANSIFAPWRMIPPHSWLLPGR
jgi:hypothetical protein